MRDVQHQLADYWAEITEDLEAPILDDVLVERVGDGEVRALSPRLDSRRRPGWMTAAAAFGLVALAGFAVWMVGIGGETDEVADDTLAVTQTSTVTTAVTDGTVPAPAAVPDPEIVVPAEPAGNLINVVNDVTAAADGSVWAATAGGVVRWDTATRTPTVHGWEAIGVQPAAAWSRSRISAGPDASVWVGGPGWLARWDGTWTQFDAGNGTTGPLAVDDDGTVWVGYTDSSLARFDGTDWEWFPYVAPLRSESVAVAPDGTVWAGTSSSDDSRDGLRVFDGEDWTRIGLNGTLFPVTIGDSVAVALDGSLWVGSRGEDSVSAEAGGVARFDGSEWSVFTIDDGLASNRSEVVAGSDGSVWAVSADGVARFDGTGFVPYPEATGFGLGAAVDAAGAVWAPSEGLGMAGFDGTEAIRLVIQVDLPVGTWEIAATYEGWLDPIKFGGGFAAIRTLDPFDGPADVWLSADGDEWGPAPEQPDGDILSLTTDGSTLFATAVSEFTPRPVWVSDTGGSWTAAIGPDDVDALLDVGSGACRGWCGGEAAVAAGPAGAVAFGVDNDRIVGLVYRDGRFEQANIGEIDDLESRLRVAVLESGMVMTVENVGDNDFGGPLVSYSATGEFWPAPGPSPESSPLSQPAAEIRSVESFGGQNLVTLNNGYGLWATDGQTWNEIRLRPAPDGWTPQVAAGEAGWIIYSPARQEGIDPERGWHSGPFLSNLGLWYSPDAVAWNELSDLGPLAPTAGSVEHGALQAQVMVDGGDLLLFAHIGELGGWGEVRGPRTEIWRLPLETRG